MWWLHDNGARVLLATHSQGTVLAAAALARRGPAGEGPDRERSVALVTFGSPLRKLYSWGFPAYVTPELLARLAAGSASLGPREWLNVWYPSDPIGGPVLPPALPAGPAVGVDVRLSDPWTSRYRFGQPLPPVTGHSGYWVDPRMWALVDGVAARLRDAVRPEAVTGRDRTGARRVANADDAGGPVHREQ